MTEKEKHHESCFLSGNKGPTQCCDGNCLHKVNCSCGAFTFLSKQYIQNKIDFLREEIKYWEAKHSEVNA